MAIKKIISFNVVQNNRTENSIRNSVIGIFMQFLQAISSFACRMIFVRYLSQEYLGVNGLFTDVISFLAVAELGIGTAISFELYKALAEKNKETVVALMSFYRKAYAVIGIIVAGIGLILLPFIHLIINEASVPENIYCLFLLYLMESVFSYFFSYKQTIIQAAQQNYIVSTAEAIFGIIKNIVQIIILVIAKNFILYLLVQIIFKLLCNIFLANIANKMFPIIRNKSQIPLNIKTKKQMLENVRYVFVTNLFSKLVNSTDSIIITFILGLAVSGLNSNYTMIIATISSFTSKIQDGVLASIGNVNAIENNEKRMKLFYEIYFIFFWIYLWCTTCFIVLVNDTINLLFGTSYVLPIEIAFICGINFFQTQIFNVIISYRTTLGLFKYGRYTTLATGVVNILLSVYLGQKLGVFGILLATFICRMVTLDWYYPYVIFKYGFKVSSFKYYIKTILYWLIGGIEIAIVFFVCSVVNFIPIINIFIKGLICMILPNFIIFFVFCKTLEYQGCKEKITNVIKRKFIKY